MSKWIAAQFRRAIDQTIAGFGDWCVTLESNADSAHWAQLTFEHLNLAFPVPDEPGGLVKGLPDVPELEIVDFKSGLFLTFAHGAGDSLPAIAEFIAKYAEQVLGESITPHTWSVSEEAI